jgi:ABC-type bacteriocin/lantibiotic exporter with double-glycine peptidase domain
MYKQGQLSFKIKTRLSETLFQLYLSKKYSYFFLKKTSEILRNIRISPIIFSNLITALLTLMLDLIVIIVLVSFLIYINTIVTLFLILFFGFFVFLIYRHWKKRLYDMGIEKQNIESTLIKTIYENILLIKEIILYGKEAFFLKIFGKKISRDAKVTFDVDLIQLAPKIAIELIVALIISLLILYLSLMQTPKEELIFILGSFSIVAIRLMPNVSRITQSLQKIKFFTPYLNLLYEELFLDNIKTEDKFIEHEKNFIKQKLYFKNLNFSYNHKTNVFKNNINLEINSGDLIGISGKSGSGKSTFVNLITGLLVPKEGHIEIDKKNIFDNIKQWQNGIGYVPQNIYLIDDSIAKNIALGEEKIIDENKINEAIKFAQLEDFVSKLPDKLNSSVGEQGILISGGQKQRIGLARIFYKDPKIIILDEATASLDKKVENEILDLILKLKSKKTILIVSHDPNVLKHCDQVFSIENNSIINQNGN